MGNEKCDDHSGCIERIRNCEETDKTQWAAIESIRDKIDGMKNWLIGVLVGVTLQLIATLFSYITQTK